MPHISYDLDGDGQVSQKDYFLAKQFDKDADGVLNADEFAAAKKALQEGYSNRFLFGLEAGANRLSHNSQLPGFDYEARHRQKVSNHLNHIRVLQKRGKHLVGEDFTPLADEIRQNLEKTRDGSALNGFKTRTEMVEARKSKDVNLMAVAKNQHESRTL